MDLATIIGLVLGFVAILGGMIAKGASLSSLANPAAFLIIFLGTAASVSIAFPGSKLKMVPKLFKIIFLNKKGGLTNAQLIEILSTWATESRKNGMLSLETKISEVENDFLKRTMKLAIDGIGPEQLRDLAETEIISMEDRHTRGALIFTQAGTYAPTLGVLGAVIGLVAALGNLGDIEKLGHAIAGAFIATLLGIFTGYVMWHPFANKLKQKSLDEVFQKQLIVEGVLMIQAGFLPSLVEKKLLATLSELERQAIASSKETKKGKENG